MRRRPVLASRAGEGRLTIVPGGTSLGASDAAIRQQARTHLEAVIAAAGEAGATILAGPMYTPWLTIESFGFALGPLSAAAAIWRDPALTPEAIVFSGVTFLRAQAP